VPAGVESVTVDPWQRIADSLSVEEERADAYRREHLGDHQAEAFVEEEALDLGQRPGRVRQGSDELTRRQLTNRDGMGPGGRTLHCGGRHPGG
jgi:hypothetical protein